MIFLDDVDPIEFAKKYRIEMRSLPCMECKKVFLLDRPFRTKEGFGFIQSDHGCPSGRSPSTTVFPDGCSTPTDDEIAQILRDRNQRIKENNYE